MCFAKVRRDALEGRGGCPSGAAPMVGIEVQPMITTGEPEMIEMKKMKTAVLSACVLMAAGGSVFAQSKDTSTSDATRSQGSPGDIKAQIAPGGMSSDKSPGGGTPQPTTGSQGAAGTTNDAASSATRSQGAPGDIKAQVAPGTPAATGSPGTANPAAISGGSSNQGAMTSPGSSTMGTAGGKAPVDPAEATRSQGTPAGVNPAGTPGTGTVSPSTGVTGK